jgi:hypothetical protein
MQEDTTLFLFTDKAPAIFRSFFAGPMLFALFLAVFLTFFLFSRPGAALWARFRLLPVLVLALVPLCSAVFFFGSEYPSYAQHSRDYRELLDIYQAHRSLVVEGQVHVLHEQALGGHDDPDLVEIDGAIFEIADAVSFGYTQTIARGGVLTEGSPVIVYYCLCPSNPAVAPPPTILRIDSIARQ